MRIHRTIAVSRSNGPGARFALWVQGCSRHCPDCFNPSTHDPCGGYETAVSVIIKQIPLGEVDGITVSGGEPFEQSDELLALLKETGKIGLHRLVYTGYTYEALRSRKDYIVEKCLAETEILIDGAYEKGSPPYMPWTGSGNQRVIQLKDGKIHKIYENNELNPVPVGEGEIVIDRNGGILTTGIIDSRVFIGQ